jgi:GNAT superfamily N-acetyltransferase
LEHTIYVSKKGAIGFAAGHITFVPPTFIMTTTEILDPSTFILREATPAEKYACWRTNSVSWAGKLTVDDYVGRETVNGSQDLTRNGGIRYWVFTAPPTAGGPDGKEIYAAVESLRKPVAVKTSDGGFSIEWSYGIASVFTPPNYRSMKIAAWMMRRLGEWVDSEEAGCRFSVLYSDVGVRTVRPVCSLRIPEEVPVPIAI